MLPNHLEFCLCKTTILIEYFVLHIDFPKIMQQPPQCNKRKLLFRQMTEHSHHCRENSNIDAVRKRICIVHTNISQLHEVFTIIEKIKDNGISNFFEWCGIECPVFCDRLKGIINGTDRLDTCLFLNDVRRRCDTVARIHRRDSHGLYTKLSKFTNIFNSHGSSLDKIASAGSIKETLPKNHAVLKFRYGKSQHSPLPHPCAIDTMLLPDIP